MAAPISTTYSEEERATIAEHILAELAGGRAVSRILREDDGMPAARTFWNWYYADAELMQKVTCARVNGVESIMDETIDIADDVSNDTIKDDNGQERPNSEWISRSRLRVDTRHKYAQMIAPRKYGPKLDLTTDGEKLAQSDDTTLAVRAAAIVRQVLERHEPE